MTNKQTTTQEEQETALQLINSITLKLSQAMAIASILGAGFGEGGTIPSDHYTDLALSAVSDLINDSKENASKLYGHTK